MYQQIIICLLLILVSLSSWGIEDVTLNNKTVFFNDPKGKTWKVDGDAIYLRSRNTFINTSYNFDFGWGYLLNAKYDLNYGRAVNVKWIHFAEENVIPTTEQTAVFENVILSGRQSQELKIINVNLKQEVSFIDRMLITLFAGVQYVDYEKFIDIQGISILVSEIITGATSFYGVGPRIGLGIDYHFFQTFTFSIEAGYSSIIYRVGKTNLNNTQIPAGGTTTNIHEELNEKGPIGGFEGNMLLSYALKRPSGIFQIHGGIMGISFDIKDTKFEGFRFGASWTGYA